MAALTAAAILVAAGATSYFAHENLAQAKDARKKQDALEAQRAAELKNEAAAREAAIEKAKSAGARAGAGSVSVSALGFGSGNTTKGLGAGTLFGN